MVNFPFPGSYLIEAINNSTNEVIVSSGTISVHSADFAVTPLTTSSGGTSVTTTSIQTAASTSSTSLLHSGNGTPSSTSSLSTDDAGQTIIHTISVESTLSLRSPSIAPPGDSTTQSLSPSHLTKSSSMGGEALTSTATTPASTSNNSNPRKRQKTSTIIGAVIGVIGFLLLLLLGVALCRHLHRNRSPILIPSPKGMFPYLQIRPSPQDQRHGMMRTLRENDVTAPASAGVITSTLMDSFMVDVEGVPGTDLPRKGSEPVTDTRRTSVASDVNVPAPSLTGSFSARGSLQILGGEQLSHPSTAALLSHAGNNEITEEITRLRTRIQELVIDRAQLWDQDNETEPPPAYVKDA
ncbi:hypothetical protein EV421DRAFT_2040695 [Armillaria borealis]|uniref:Uncharacterized protein n=1 Tax=Armillaria borealis TaxID=47425 RepID=A0AA39J0Z6_9AGAR|nr:hypothetical protein EV421DRAFT_2040695 [Armillaria borealis]